MAENISEATSPAQENSPLLPGGEENEAPSEFPSTAPKKRKKQQSAIKRPQMTALMMQQSIRERRNWLIHQLYIRQEFMDCLSVIEQQLRDCEGVCEYALFVKGLILRSNGELVESLSLFQAAAMLNPTNKINLKQVGRALYLLGNHEAAIEAYHEVLSRGVDDWEVHQSMGLCYVYMQDLQKAEKSFLLANSRQKQDSTYLQLGRLYASQRRYNDALKTFRAGLEVSPENPDLLTEFGLTALKLGDVMEAFDNLGSSLAFDARNPATVLAAGSIIQDNGDYDVALNKYRVVATQMKSSAQLWSNIGVCFLGKRNHIAAIACLRKAQQLAPFDWIVPFNLGCVFLNTGQHASAFHCFSTSISLKKDYAPTYMYIGICLSKMDDFDNAIAAYKKAVMLESGDYLIILNYAIALFHANDIEGSKAMFDTFSLLFEAVDPAVRRTCDRDVIRMKDQLSRVLCSS